MRPVVVGHGFDRQAFIAQAGAMQVEARAIQLCGDGQRFPCAVEQMLDAFGVGQVA
jgi:hypothetical protein